MQFLKDLIHWFIYGTVATADDDGRPEQPVFSVVTPEPDSEVQPEPINVVENILASGRRENFLKELQSIKPMSKEFDKARDELVQEIKKLSKKRHA